MVCIRFALAPHMALACLIGASLAGCGGDDGNTLPAVAAAQTAKIGGEVSGIPAGSQVVITNNGSDRLTLTEGGSFTFATPLAIDKPYVVAIASTSSDLACSVLYATGVASRSGNGSAKIYCGPNRPVAFSTVASMATPRELHQLVTLRDGTILAIAGNAAGQPQAAVASIERYDPATNRWRAAGVLSSAVTRPGVHLLRNDNVLLVQGPTAILYDPVTATATNTRAYVSIVDPRTSAILLDGRVMVSDGQRVEVFDAASGSWQALESTHYNHGGGSLVVLDDGRVLFAGNVSGSFESFPSEVFDVASGHWQDAGKMPGFSGSDTGRSAATLQLLPGGKVLAIGGLAGRFDRNCGCGPTRLQDALLFDPASGSWLPGGALSVAKSGFTATLMPSGKVLVAGGNLESVGIGTPFIGGNTRYSLPFAQAAVELYDPSTNRWSLYEALVAARTRHGATLSRDGKLFVTGGVDYVTNAVVITSPSDYFARPVTTSEAGL